MAQTRELPADAPVVAFDEIDSTNAEALRRAGAGETGPLWIHARAQSSGRGRHGRPWVSDPGNLYASLLLTVEGPPTQLTELAFVAGLALFDAVSACLPADVVSSLSLKWPNDLLFDDAKVAGILLESAGLNAEAPWQVAVGFGLNLASHPEGGRHPATHLAAHGATARPEEALRALVAAFAHRHGVWRGADGFAAVRAAWLERAKGLGEAISVDSGQARIEGRFAGIDRDGALLVAQDGGATARVMAGDVFLSSEKKGREA